MTRRLTLNLGLRYDLQPNSFANFVEVYPILKGGRRARRRTSAPGPALRHSSTTAP